MLLVYSDWLILYNQEELSQAPRLARSSRLVSCDWLILLQSRSKLSAKIAFFRHQRNYPKLLCVDTVLLTTTQPPTFRYWQLAQKSQNCLVYPRQVSKSSKYTCIKIENFEVSKTLFVFYSDHFVYSCSNLEVKMHIICIR